MSDRTCSFPGCEGRHSALGYCAAHRAQLKRGGPLKPLRIIYRGALCSVEGCPDGARSQGWCARHYGRWLAAGRPAEMPPEPPTRKYPVDEGYFDAITDEHRAYWLGFIVADGNVLAGRTHRVSVTLKASDIGHLNLFRAALGTTAPIRLTANGCAVFSVHSRHMALSLIRLGVTPAKGSTVEPWNGPPELMPHYWRGLFDGDGHIGRRRAGGWLMTQCASRACILGFADWAHRACGSAATPVHVAGGCWKWQTGGLPMPQRLARALYGTATIALARKRELADELMSISLAEAKAAAGAKRSRSMAKSWERRKALSAQGADLA